MRILHITNSGQTATLGVEKEVATLALAQRSRGSDVMIAIDSQGIFMDSCRESGIPVVVSNNLKTPENEQAALENAVNDLTERCLAGFNPDVIHCHTLTTAIVSIRSGNRIGIPCAITADAASVTSEGWAKGMRFHVLCLTMSSIDELASIGIIPKSHIHYVPNGSEVVPQPQPQPQLVTRSPALISVGSLIPRKGNDILIRAMFELRKKLGRSCPSLDIYGDGPMRETLQELTSTLELDEIVQFHGFESGIMERCSAANILVLASRQEKSPLIVLEAMSRGIPIVATDVGEVSNMIPDRRYGHVCRPDSPIDLARAIELCLLDIADARFDRNLLIERHHSLYSTEKFAERTEAVYRKILVKSSMEIQP